MVRSRHVSPAHPRRDQCVSFRLIHGAIKGALPLPETQPPSPISIKNPELLPYCPPLSMALPSSPGNPKSLHLSMQASPKFKSQGRAWPSHVGIKTFENSLGLQGPVWRRVGSAFPSPMDAPSGWLACWSTAHALLACTPRMHRVSLTIGTVPACTTTALYTF